MGFLIEKGQLPFIPPPPAAKNTPPIPDWVPSRDDLNDLGDFVGEPIEFTEREIRLILSSLPTGPDPKRIEILPLLLGEWARVELRWHFAKMPLPLLAQQRKRMKKVAKQATALIQALDELKGPDRWELVGRLGIAEGLGLLGASHDEKNKRRIDVWRSLTATIAAAAAEPTWKPNRGQPRKAVAQLVLQDLAALFEHVTGLRASRVVDRHTREESGPFLTFANAVWPVVFGNGDYGLVSQLRSWADDGARRSDVVRGVAIRLRKWGIIPTL